MATAKKSSTRKKTASSRSSARKRTGTTARSGSAGQTRGRTAQRTAPKKTGSIWNNLTIGLGLLLMATVLVLALCRMDGVLLDGVLHLVGGLIGWGTQLFWVALCLAGIFVLCELPAIRLRVLCILTFPVLWSALAQSILMQPMSLSFPTVIQLWEEGMALRAGGVLGGVLATLLTVLLSTTGAKILLVLLMSVYVFIIFNTTPVRLYRGLVHIIAEDTEQLREDDMSVTPADEPETPKKVKNTKKRGSLFAFLRSQRAKRRAEKLRAGQAKAEMNRTEEEIPIQEPEADPPESDAVKAAKERYARRAEQRRRLADVLPEEPDEAADTPPWETGAAPWHTADEQPRVPTESGPQPEQAETKPETMPEDTKPSAAEVQQTHREISDAMETPAPEYRYPPIDLLQSAPRTSNAGVRAELKDSSERLVDTLASFGIDVRIISIVRGPSVTRFEIQMERGVKFSRITALSDDIALALGAYSVRIAPIPDKLAIGIEVPNRNVQTVALRDVISSRGFEQSAARLAVALGKDITGSAQIIDLAKMPHLLIAGTTGSGKSVCINSILISLLYKSSPEDVRLIMIDPKMVELGNYNGIPHLLIPVVTNPKKASGALSWAVGEMERRYSLFAAAGVRDLKDYNAHARLLAAQWEQGEETPLGRRPEPLPQIVIVIDELADLMMVAAKEVETSICRIAQKARAAGMHLVVATQRPSADVITGIMKSNIPSRIAFAVASQVESRIILDTPGADKLIGKGDMLYSPIGMSKPVRIQGCFVSSEEIERVIEFVKSTSTAEYSEEVMQQIERQSEAENSAAGYNGAEDEDELLPQAITIVVESGQASVSMLQRRLKLGYARAARLVDQMEQRGIVGPFEGSKPRQVLITKDDWMEIQLRQKL